MKIMKQSDAKILPQTKINLSCDYIKPIKSITANSWFGMFAIMRQEIGYFVGQVQLKCFNEKLLDFQVFCPTFHFLFALN